MLNDFFRLVFSNTLFTIIYLFIPVTLLQKLNPEYLVKRNCKKLKASDAPCALSYLDVEICVRQGLVIKCFHVLVQNEVLSDEVPSFCTYA